ncbi:hypothetical protein GDO86_003552 [Hymenochirus boettgeri]|uniref:Uncharacterized protein n=1 Tax=Hymenochirus boettgeri TaxID=247094 RepID=A0A8T2KA45_9PIPI|nr:hypothetical protein GDO86_003552 [Hymenochirus boettgeri]
MEGIKYALLSNCRSTTKCIFIIKRCFMYLIIMFVYLWNYFFISLVNIYSNLEFSNGSTNISMINWVVPKTRHLSLTVCHGFMLI